MSSSSATNYEKTLLLSWSLGQNPSVAAPASTVLALFTALPTDLGTDGTEVSGGNYARQPIVWGAPFTDTANITTISNSNLIVFPQATANWGILAGGAVYGIDGNGVSRMAYYGDIYPAKTINLGQVFQVLPGDLVIEID